MPVSVTISYQSQKVVYIKISFFSSSLFKRTDSFNFNVAVSLL